MVVILEMGDDKGEADEALLLSHIARMRPELTHLPRHELASSMCNRLGIMRGASQAILLISWFLIRPDTSAIARELRFSHCPKPGVVTGGAGHVAEAPLPIPNGNCSPSGIEARGNLECAVNVPYGDNWLSTSSHFCNLGNTFRASVSWG